MKIPLIPWTIKIERQPETPVLDGLQKRIVMPKPGDLMPVTHTSVERIAENLQGFFKQHQQIPFEEYTKSSLQHDWTKTDGIYVFDKVTCDRLEHDSVPVFLCLDFIPYENNRRPGALLELDSWPMFGFVKYNAQTNKGVYFSSSQITRNPLVARTERIYLMQG